jgi:hypothetical protein
VSKVLAQEDAAAKEVVGLFARVHLTAVRLAEPVSKLREPGTLKRPACNAAWSPAKRHSRKPSSVMNPVLMFLTPVVPELPRRGLSGVSRYHAKEFFTPL